MARNRKTRAPEGALATETVGDGSLVVLVFESKHEHAGALYQVGDILQCSPEDAALIRRFAKTRDA